MDAVIAPPAVLPVVIRAPAAATSAVSNVLSPIRSPAAVGIMSEIGTPPVTAVPEALLLCDTEMQSQIPPETGFSPQVDAACPDVGLVTSKVSPDIANGSRERDYLILITTVSSSHGGRERPVGCPALKTRRRTRVIEHSGPTAVSDINGPDCI